MFFELVLLRGFKNCEDIKKACLEYTENIKMMNGAATSMCQQKNKSNKDQKEAKIDEICKQVGNLHLMMMKQHWEDSKQAEPVCYECSKKGFYSSLCRMKKELTYYKCGKKGHRASECRSKAYIPPACTHCHRVGHTTENCFVEKSNEAVEKQDVRSGKNTEPTDTKGTGSLVQDNIMFVKEDDPIEEDYTVAAFKKSADGEILTKQQQMQNDTDAYNETQLKP